MGENNLHIKSEVNYKVWFIVVIIGLLLYFSALNTEVNIIDLFTNTDQMVLFLKKFLHPDWAYLSIVIQPMIETIQMSIVGTAIGSIAALPAAFLATNIITNSWKITALTRAILNISRTIPELLLAVLFVAIVGIGSFSGVLALSVFTFGMVSKLLYESIETIDRGPIEAMTAVGANRIQIIFFAIMPQMMSHLISYVLYAFEINIRASTILGYIGAGGIGIFLQRGLSQLRYDRVSVIIILIFIVVLMIDYLSSLIRKKWL